MYYRARYYDPKVGRFISEDPIGSLGGNNFYAYVDNRPTNRRDPSGLASTGGCCDQDYPSCLAKCIERERLSLEGTLVTLGVTLGAGTMPKTLKELRGLGVPKKELNPYTNELSRMAGRTGVRSLRDIGRSVAGRAVGGIATAALVFEGFYDIGAILRCSVVCADDTCSY